MMDSLYYECHVTIEPVYDDRLLELKNFCDACGFRVADLLMKKSASDVAKPSEIDTFCSGRDDDYYSLYNRMVILLEMLQTNCFKIYRYKIEQVVLDSKIKDKLGVL